MGGCSGSLGKKRKKWSFEGREKPEGGRRAVRATSKGGPRTRDAHEIGIRPTRTTHYDTSIRKMLVNGKGEC